jgi:hypothetical protein
MGWVESPPYFGAASKTARWYAEMPMGTIEEHKFSDLAMKHDKVAALPRRLKTTSSSLNRSLC